MIMIKKREGGIPQNFHAPRVWTQRGRGFPSPPGFEILPAMNTFVSAVLILWIFGMVIYLTKDM